MPAQPGAEDARAAAVGTPRELLHAGHERQRPARPVPGEVRHRGQGAVAAGRKVAEVLVVGRAAFRVALHDLVPHRPEVALRGAEGTAQGQPQPGRGLPPRPAGVGAETVLPPLRADLGQRPVQCFAARVPGG